MKYIKQDFSLKAWVQSPGVDLESGAKAKIKLFRNMVMLHIKLKQQCGRKYFAHRRTLDSGDGVKRSNHFLSESSHVAYQVEGIEHRTP